MSPQNSDSVSSEFRPVLQELNAPAHMGLAEILQTCCSNHKSGQLTFHSGESSGYIYLQHGRVIHAVCGLAEGEEAVYRMLLWPEGWFSLDSEVLPHQKTIDLTLEQLLFEGARRADILAGGAELTPTVVTAEPLTKTRLTKQSQPRLTIILPDQRPQIFDLKAEYTHVGRASENEIALPDASISNRHCMFIQSGSDIFLRDLNSSNGTSVNGESITEVLLRPGDLIRVGLVQMKFESGVRRPKLTNTNAGTFGDVRELGPARRDSRVTIKIPLPSLRPAPAVEVKTDSDFVKGESAISYDNLAKPEVPSKSLPFVRIVVGATLLVLILVGGAYLYFVKFAH